MIRIAILGLALLGAAPAAAATYGFQLSISGNTNVPVFTFENISDSALITAAAFTIGNTTQNFDYIRVLESPAGGATQITIGDTANGGTRFDEVAVSFTSFDPGDTARVETDIDPDNSNALRDYRTVMFNNGTAPNSVFTVNFSNGAVLDLTLPDAPVASAYSYSVSSALPAVPLPASALFLLAGLGGLGVARARKRRA